jgi:hypothetical protein
MLKDDSFLGLLGVLDASPVQLTFELLISNRGDRAVDALRNLR